MIGHFRGDLDASVHRAGVHHHRVRRQGIETPAVDAITFDILVKRWEHRPTPPLELDAEKINDVEVGQDIVE